LRLTGKSVGTARTYTYDNLRFPLRDESNDFLPRLWATRRVGWLMEQIRSNGESKELRDEVVDLGTRYGIVTPYTSYLALEGREAQQITSAAPASTPRPSATFGGFSNRPPAKARGGTGAADSVSTVGEAAVVQSKRERLQQEAARVDSDSPTSVRRLGTKTFYMRDGVWIDSEFKENSGLPETKLNFGSDDYYALLKQKPALANYFSLGERVVVVFEGRIYIVNAVNP
jgi:Ca-activated chloride channel family protein